MALAFERFKEKSNINICEIGIDIGGSIALWSKYFENGNVIGIDINSIRLDEQYKEENFNNVKYYINDAYDKEFIKSLPLFDIIIDDGPHTFGTMLKFIQNYVDKLNPGGLMVIEDIPDESWINYFKILTPKNLKTTVIDLRQIDNRYDSLMFAIEKV
jgi:SAM-dependent methyltransferase